MRLGTLVCSALLLGSTACSRGDEERARVRADEAKDKAVAAARKLGSEAQSKTRELNDKLGQSLNRGGSGGNLTPEEKLDQAGAIARRESVEAGKKLDHAGMLAKVKTSLASSVGLGTLSSVNVEVTGSVVTLSGSVSSGDQRRQAELAVSSIDGVSRVVNELTVSQ